MILAVTKSLTCHEQWPATDQANCKLLATSLCTILWHCANHLPQSGSKEASQVPETSWKWEMSCGPAASHVLGCKFKASSVVLLMLLHMHKTDGKKCWHVLTIKIPKQPIASEEAYDSATVSRNTVIWVAEAVPVCLAFPLHWMLPV